MRKLLFFVAFALLVAGIGKSAPYENRIIQIPFHDVHGRIVLDTSLDGKPATLLFDTGAEMSFRLDKPGALILSIHNGEARFETEQPSRSPVVLQLEFPVQGIIGTDVLKRFRSVRIDYQNHLVELNSN